MQTIISIGIITIGALWFGFLLIAFFGKMLVTLWSIVSTQGKRWLQQAEEAEALVLQVESTGLYVGEEPQLRLQIQVMPGRGRNFVTEINTLAKGRMLSLKSGETIRVKFNPKNYRELFLINAA